MGFLSSPCTSYDNAALVGDSIAYMLIQCENQGDYLGKLLFLARGGTSMMGLVNRFKNVYFQGQEMNLEDAIAASNVDRVYMMVGSNDIACDPNREAFFDNWDIMLERIRDKSPGVEIVVISNIPKNSGAEFVRAEQQELYNIYMKEYNEKLEQYCRKNDCGFLDLYYYVQDHYGNLPPEYDLDGYHFNDTGYMNWIKIMRYYAEYELAGGTLS